MLHIVRHSPHTDNRFATCLRVLASGQGMLLIEDAVYALLPDAVRSNQISLLPAAVKLYVLEADLMARGLALDDIPTRVQLIDYPGMVAICASYPKVISW